MARVVITQSIAGCCAAFALINEVWHKGKGDDALMNVVHFVKIWLIDHIFR